MQAHRVGKTESEMWLPKGVHNGNRLKLNYKSRSLQSLYYCIPFYYVNIQTCPILTLTYSLVKRDFMKYPLANLQHHVFWRALETSLTVVKMTKTCLSH